MTVADGAMGKYRPNHHFVAAHNSTVARLHDSPLLCCMNGPSKDEIKDTSNLTGEQLWPDMEAMFGMFEKNPPS